MPYIHWERRRELIIGDPPDTPGELNFVLCAAADTYVRRNADEFGGMSYDMLNDVYGAMQAAAAEFYRRVVSKYEDQKIAENGDVFLCLEEPA